MTECPRAITDDEAVRLMTPTAVVYAKRLSRHDRSLTDDLIQEGLMGAVEAARTFDASRGLKFTTYARLRVHGQMCDHLRAINFVSRNERQRAAEEGRGVVRVVSLDGGMRPGKGDDESSQGKDRWRFDPSHHDPEPSDGAEAEFAAWVRREFPGRLVPHEIGILAAYYTTDLRLWEIAEHFGVCESRVSQIVGKALRTLRGGEGAVGVKCGHKANKAGQGKRSRHTHEADPCTTTPTPTTAPTRTRSGSQSP